MNYIEFFTYSKNSSKQFLYEEYHPLGCDAV
jgi:hypothetical protein